MPVSQTITAPAPYLRSPITPSKSRWSSEWSSTSTASRFTRGSVDRPSGPPTRPARRRPRAGSRSAGCARRAAAPRISASLAALELQHLLERRPVGAPHRVRDQARAGSRSRLAVVSHVSGPGRRTAAASLVRRPRASVIHSDVAAVAQRALAAVAQVELALDLVGRAACAGPCRRSDSPAGAPRPRTLFTSPSRLPNTRAASPPRRSGARAASMIAGPASSYLPSLSASRRGASRRTQSSSRSTTCWSRARSAPARRAAPCSPPATPASGRPRWPRGSSR